MKKILITGGAGFIGSNLCNRLVEQGYNVVAIDNLITSSRKNITPLIEFPNFKFIKHDITLPFKSEQKKHLKDIDLIFHLACPTGVPNLLKLGEEMLLTSSLGTKNILDIALKEKARVVFTSTSEVYGDPLKSPQDEGYAGNVDPVGMRSTYEEGKRFAESLIALYVRKYNLDCRIVRVFNTYGPRMFMSDTRVIPNFIQHIKEKKKLPLHGNGSQKRTFCYIEDLINGLLIVAEKGKKGEVYNLGSDEEVSIFVLANMILSILDLKNGIKKIKRPDHDHSARMPDLQKMHSLKWLPKTSLDEGLRRTLQWYGL